jgi:WS/DGAT/MGAT family acyltransferase
MDAVFLYGETANAPLNVMGVVIFEKRSPAPGADYARLRAQIADRLPALPVLRRKLVEVPLGLEHPLWTDDPHVDLDAHIHRSALPAPGGESELWTLIARLAETPLHRDRPLWEMHVVEGLEKRRFALVAKIHHAAVDGIGAAQILAGLLDRDPDGKRLIPVAPGSEDRSPLEAPAPSSLRLLADATWALGKRPLRVVRQLASGGGAGASLVYKALRGGSSRAPRTCLNGPVSSKRVVATGSVSLDEVKVIKRAFGATVNHVVLAACAGALRRYLASHGETPEAPLVAAVPMALGERNTDGAGNSISVLFVRLPVNEERADDRLAAAREASLEAMQLHKTVGPQLGDWAELATPALFAGAARIYHGLGLAAHHAPFHNLVISNVPGPTEPLYCAGSRVRACHPFGPIYDGWGLNLTVMSYAGRVALGAIACADRVVDVAKIPRGFEEEVAGLFRLASRHRGPPLRRDERDAHPRRLATGEPHPARAVLSAPRARTGKLRRRSRSPAGARTSLRRRR